MKHNVRQLLARVGYPAEWLADAQRYGSDDAYVVFNPDWAEEIPPIPQRSVDAIVERQARTQPEAAAIIYLGRTLTYADLHSLVGRAAAVLRGAGVGVGDVVAVMVPTSAMHWVIFFALARLGAIHCGVNVMYRAEELRFLLGDAQPKVVICADELLSVVEQALEDSPRRAALFTVSTRDLADPDFAAYPGLEASWNYDRAEPAAVPAMIDEMRTAAPILTSAPLDDVAKQVGQIVYTAGTTGTPKGVLQTHYNLVHNAVTHTIAMPGVRTPVTISALPLFHSGGFFVYSLPTFVRGGTVIPRPLFDPEDTMAAIGTHRVNVLFGPPTLYAAFLARGVDQFDLSSLAICATGAAPIPAALPQRWKQATGLDLHGGWGMSELNSLGTFNGLPGRPAPGTLGLPVVGEVRITVDGQVAARYVEGEIEFRGKQVSAGYLGRPQDTAAAFGADGWLKTGDVGLIDQTDALHYVDRKKDLIFVSGYNISPAEIEATLLRHPKITDAAVVPEDDAYRGEIPVAFVVGAVTDHEVAAYCREQLAAIKTPRKVIVVDALPKNALGKTSNANSGPTRRATMARTHDLSVVARNRRQREREARRNSILAAAQETFSARGFAGSTMEEVALRAEITKPTLYGYFRTKDELLLTLMLPVFADIGAELQGLHRDLEAGLIGDCAQLITRLLDAVLTPYNTDPARFRLTQLLHQTRLVESLDPASLAALDIQGRTDFTLARSILRMAAEQGLIRAVPAGPLADLIWGIVVGTIQVEDIKNRTGGRPQHAATLRLANELLVSALHPTTTEREQG